MIKDNFIDELTNDVLVFLKKQEIWEHSKKFPNFISKHKKKYQEYLIAYNILLNKYKFIENNENKNIILPSAPPLEN